MFFSFLFFFVHCVMFLLILFSAVYYKVFFFVSSHLFKSSGNRVQVFLKRCSF